MVVDTKKMAKSIVDHLNDPVTKTEALINSLDGQTRIILCGASGTGKTLSVNAANELLGEDEQIAEVNEILRLTSFEEAAKIAGDYELRPELAKHVAFNMIDEEIATKLEQKLNIKVFWF